jgi:DNA-directed RNA polymerase, mitochondrial
MHNVATHTDTQERTTRAPFCNIEAQRCAAFNDDWSRQAELEGAALAHGQARYWHRLDQLRGHSAEQFTAPARAMLAKHLPILSAAIAERLSAGIESSSRSEALAHIRDMNPEALAFHSLRACFAAMNGPAATVRIALAIGRALESDQRLAAWKHRDPLGYRLAQRRVADAANATQRRQCIEASRSTSADVTAWTERARVKAGVYLIDALIASTGLFADTLERELGDRLRTLTLADAARQMIDRDHRTAALFVPVHLPMVVAPLDWVSPTEGGYLTSTGGSHALIKTRNALHLSDLEGVAMPAVYSAINAVQATAWRINADVLTIAEQCRDGNEEIGRSMLARERIEAPEPPCPRSELPKLKAADRATYTKWARVAASVHACNKARDVRRAACADKLNIARLFANEPALYFPHQLDFRGRLYPIPEKLNPQGGDLAKGLLMFATGKPLGARGLYWLQVHTANCCGVDKVSFDDRIAWTEQNRAAISRVHSDPHGAGDIWKGADDPWQALAAMLELSRAWASGDPEGFVSRLPIPMDGSCNGLQHFSALLRDPVGGKATNLVPRDKPADIYAEVAQKVAERVRLDALAGNPLAVTWDGKVTRRLIKQPVMTLSYGATRIGMREQLAAAANELYPELATCADTWDACGYLAGVTFESIGAAVSAAHAAMNWLQTTARVAAAADQPMQWTSPLGLPVRQDYREPATRPVEVHIGGRRTELTLASDTQKLDRRRQAQCISPNFIHSLDAAHLMASVNAASADGIKALAVVHDCYGTHAADTDALHRHIREAFIEQYGGNLLQTFRAEVCARLSTDDARKVPACPALGRLELGGLRLSRYFFA